MARFLRISKSACVSKEITILELHLPTVYQRKLRAKLAIINKHLSTADSAIGQVFFEPFLSPCDFLPVLTRGDTGVFFKYTGKMALG